MARGELSTALRMNALWVIVLPGAAYVGAVRLGDIARVRLPRPAWKARHSLALMAAMAGFAVARNLPYPPFRLLAPPSTGGDH